MTNVVEGKDAPELPVTPVLPMSVEGLIASKETTPVYVKQKVAIRDTNPIEFMKMFQELVLEGCKLEEDTYPSIRSAVLEAKLVKSVDINAMEGQLVQSRPGVHVSPIQHTEYRFSEEYVKELPWETFKNLLKCIGITGRDRNKLTTQYMKYFEDKA